MGIVAVRTHRLDSLVAILERKKRLCEIAIGLQCKRVLRMLCSFNDAALAGGPQRDAKHDALVTEQERNRDLRAEVRLLRLEAAKMVSIAATGYGCIVALLLVAGENGGITNTPHVDE